MAKAKDQPLDVVLKSIGSFDRDPPDSEFQRGYLSALVTVAREAFGHDDPDLDRAELLCRDPDRRAR